MRRLVVLLACAAIVGSVAGAEARVRDGKECHESGSENAFADVGAADEPTNTDNFDRNAVCVRAGGTTLFYIGGESMSEEPGNQGTAGLCGSLTVNGETFGSGHANQGEDPSDWDFDHVHPGPDGQMGTDDDETHHHDCN